MTDGSHWRDIYVLHLLMVLIRKSHCPTDAKSRDLLIRHLSNLPSQSMLSGHAMHLYYPPRAVDWTQNVRRSNRLLFGLLGSTKFTGICTIYVYHTLYIKWKSGDWIVRYSTFSPYSILCLTKEYIALFIKVT